MTTDGVNVRELALGILLAVTKNGENSHTVLSAVLEKYQYLSRQERGFLTRLTEGTLERQLELDYIIGLFFQNQGDKTKTRNPRNSAYGRLSAALYECRSRVGCV